MPYWTTRIETHLAVATAAERIQTLVGPRTYIWEKIGSAF